MLRFIKQDFIALLRFGGSLINFEYDRIMVFTIFYISLWVLMTPAWLMLENMIGIHFGRKSKAESVSTMRNANLKADNYKKEKNIFISY